MVRFVLTGAIAWMGAISPASANTVSIACVFDDLTAVLHYTINDFDKSVTMNNSRALIMVFDQRKIIGGFGDTMFILDRVRGQMTLVPDENTQYVGDCEVAARPKF